MLGNAECTEICTDHHATTEICLMIHVMNKPPKAAQEKNEPTPDEVAGRLGAAAAVSGGGDDGVLELLAPGRDGPVSLAAAAAAPLAAAAVVAARRRAREVRVGLIPGLDGALGATVAETTVESRTGLRAANGEFLRSGGLTMCCRYPPGTLRARSRTCPSSCRCRRPCRSPSLWRRRSPPCSNSSPGSKSPTWDVSPSRGGWKTAGRRAT